MRLLDARLDIYINCNYRCVFCGEPSNEKTPSIPLNALDKLFPILNKTCWSVFLSCGGEPLLHPQFEAVLKKAKEVLTKPDVSVVTNGFNLDEHKCKSIVLSGISRIFISVHTLNSKLYAELTGTSENAIQKVRSNVELLIKMRGNNKFPKIIITTIAMKKTLPFMHELVDWVVATGIDALNVQWLLPDYNNEMKSEVVGFTSENKTLFDDLNKRLRKSKKHFYYPYVLGKEKYFSMIVDLLLIKNKINYLFFLIKKFISTRKKDGCRVIGNTIIVNHDLTAQLCHKYILSPINLESATPKSLIANLKRISKEIDRSNHQECTGCPYYNKNTKVKID